jgi:hypothetical protein
MSSFAEAIQKAHQLAAGYGGAPQAPIARAALKPDDYRLQPRRGLFTCKRCDVGEMNPPEAVDHYTAWPCWACDQDDMTLPRPIPEPAVA